MATSQTSDLRVDEIESTTNGAPVLVRGARMSTAGLAVTVSSMNIPGTISGIFSGAGSSLTNISTASTATSFAYNFIGL